MTKTEAREYVLRVGAAELRSHIGNGSEWLERPLRADSIAVDDDGRFSEADYRRVCRAVRDLADELEHRAIGLRASRERRRKP